MHDLADTVHGTVRLGRSAVKHDPRTLRLARYLAPGSLAHAPDRVRVPHVADWPMYGNDRLGDCTVASAGHMIQAWTAACGEPSTPNEDAVLDAYWGTGPSDDGRVEVDVLSYWRKKGVGGHKIEAYAAVDPGRHALVRLACFLFGGVYVGLSLPVNAQTSRAWTNSKGVGADAEPGSWGGHAVPIVGYDSRYAYVITWGRRMSMSWGFATRYMDEAYAVLSPDWLAQAGKSPSGFDLAALQADLAAITA